MKGSFTVEAAIIVPIFLFCILVALKMSIFLYQEINTQFEQEAVADLWMVDKFYKFQIIEEVKND